MGDGDDDSHFSGGSGHLNQMRIVSWAVFSVQMSFERFRTGQFELLFFNIVLFLVSKHKSEDRNSRPRLKV